MSYPMARALSPGPGWTKRSVPVWEHNSGVRIHLGGVIRDSDGEVIRDADDLPLEDRLYRYIRIAGGSRRRGMMIWAKSMFGVK